MDSPLTRAGNGAASGAESATSEDERRVEELLRVNARLAAEVRSLASGRIEGPRLGPMVSARRLAALSEERDALAARLAATEAELGITRTRCADLESHQEILSAEVLRLRAGWRGVLRRLRARLLSR